MNMYQPKHVSFRASFFAIALGLLCLNAFAQTPATPPGPTLKDLHLSCSDFRHNKDGSWSPLHPVQLGGVQLKTGVAINRGGAHGGVDLASLLNNECATH
jgi:hypothetical protein